VTELGTNDGVVDGTKLKTGLTGGGKIVIV